MAYFASASRYESMTYNRCGRSGLLLPAVSLGLWHNFGERNDFQVMKEILLNAFDLGITHFDLANNYGPPYGSAETNVGKILKNLPRDEILISSKAGYDMWPGPYGDLGSRKYLIASLDQSLQRLGRSPLDELVKSVYDDVDVGLHEMAKLSLSAHLIKLQQENRAVHHVADDAWEMLRI